MDTKKLEAWEQKLLDVGKRNNLISFKDTKASTVEVLVPSASTLFDKMEGSTAQFEVYDPQLDDDKLDIEEFSDEISEDITDRESYIKQYASHIKKDKQILIYNSSRTQFVALKNIEKKARLAIEETGVNVAYIAFGFIHWKEDESSDITFRAPLLLAPISIHRDSAISPFVIDAQGDDFLVNPTFSYKIQSEYGIELPAYTADEGFDSYIFKVKELIAKLNWTVSNESKIGIFSFLKINMYMDLRDNKEIICNNENVKLLLKEKTDGTFSMTFDDVKHLENPLVELHNVVDADSSQIAAIEAAKSGKSFVLQGPPGTGKSQTITNLIAELLYDGKKVLFVSEKLAALNVVYNKLKQAGLEDACLELHSHKANKKEVIAELNRVLNLPRINVSSKAEDVVNEKRKNLQNLDAYEDELHKPRDVINKSLYQLYEAFSSCNEYPFYFVIPNIERRSETDLTNSMNLLGQYIQYVPSIGYNYRANPWHGCKKQDMSYEAKEALKKDISDALDMYDYLTKLCPNVRARCGIDLASVNDVLNFKKTCDLLLNTTFVTPYVLHDERLAVVKKVLAILREKSFAIKTIKDQIELSYLPSVYQIDGATLIAQLNQYDTGLKRMFNSEFKELIASVKQHYIGEGKYKYEDALTLARFLIDYKSSVDDFTANEGIVKDAFGDAYIGVDTDWDTAWSELTALENLINDGCTFGGIPSFDIARFQSEKSNLKVYSDSIQASTVSRIGTLNRISADFHPEAFDPFNLNVGFCYKKLSGCLENFTYIDNWKNFAQLYSQLAENNLLPIIDQAIEKDLPAEDIDELYKKSFYYGWIQYVLNSTPVLSLFSDINQNQAVKLFSDNDKRQFEVSKSQIKAKLSQQRPSKDMIAGGSELSIIVREGEKKRKQMSVRALMDNAGRMIQVIKPCFLMSPLSVSTYLNSQGIRFDVVIFDEASQIFPWDAVGAIYRAKQIIVVGDSKQMPPSNFFNASVDNDDSDEEVGDVTDFESILDICSTVIPQLRLNWHYRSHFEELIAFSNNSFYNGGLVTFPSSEITNERENVGVDYYYVDGCFENQRNRKEAEAVVDLAFKHAKESPNRSLGIVAFSIKQQSMIEDLLEQKRRTNPEYEEFFRNDMDEPFFVKNLETVQGDERDTIIFSIGYGYDPQGRFVHNFGPLNREGGERRLNVAVTRARHNVKVVASIHYTDIDLSKTASNGAKLLRAYLDYAENGAIALSREVNVNPFEDFDSDFEKQVYDFLISKGFSADTQVGCSGYRIDIGLKRPNSSDYILAIECDGATYHSSRNARDRDRLRQEILERMGWKFYRIWSTDWFKNETVAKEKLVEACHKAFVDTSNDVPEKQTEPESQEESFDVNMGIVKTQFPYYEKVNIPILELKGTPRYEILMQVIETEAPISVTWLLKRTVHWYGNQKVTNVVRRKFEGYKSLIQNDFSFKDDFIYLKDQSVFSFRVPRDPEERRDWEYVSPEELASGMYRILEQNGLADKSGLYHKIADYLCINRVTASAHRYLDAALDILVKSGLVRIEENDMIILANRK